MRTETITVYNYNELSGEAKQVALNWWQGCNASTGYAWEGENRDTLEAFLDLFSCKLNRYGQVSTNVDHEELKGVRLMAKLWTYYGPSLYEGKYYHNKPVGAKGYKSRRSNCQLEASCVLTGYCMDDDILKPVYEAMNKPYRGTFIELMQDCINEYEEAVRRDREYQDSEEYFSEMCEANGYEFTEDGNRY